MEYPKEKKTSLRSCVQSKMSVFVSMATGFLILLAAMPSTSGQAAQSLDQCRQQCYYNYLRLYQYYCAGGSTCQYTDYLAQFYLACYRQCNQLQIPTTPAPPPPPTTQQPTSLPPSSASCGVSLVARSGGAGTEPSFSIEGRIVGGVLASECEFPWTVVINIGTTFCGGSIIDQNTVLTAGHCVYTLSGGVANARDVTVKYGSSDQGRMSSVSVTRVLLHPSFLLQYYDYDVALLTLSRPLTYGRCIQPICLPEPNASPTYSCLAAGWGALSFSMPTAQQKLQKVSLPIVSNQDCWTAFGRDSRTISDIKLCAGDLLKGGIDACLGDSGGPLMCYANGVYTLHGSVSFGRGCGNPGYPGVYARISHSSINQWIKTNMRD